MRLTCKKEPGRRRTIEWMHSDESSQRTNREMKHPIPQVPASRTGQGLTKRKKLRLPRSVATTIMALIVLYMLASMAGFMNRKHNLQDAREQLIKIARARHSSFGISAMDLKKVLDQTVRELKREVNKKVLKVPEIEMKVCEATSNEPWGPHGTIMGDIAQATRNLQEYHLIMGVLWKRLHDSGKNWRHVYKSLTVMEYLVANGAERVIDELREQAYQIQALLDFQYIEPNGKDQGINVQKKARSMLALINDRGQIRELRHKAAANRDKYRGLSSTGMTFKPSSYLSTSGSYNDEEQYKAQKDDVDGKDLECRSQRDESNRDECSCGEREHHEGCASSKGGDPNSDKGSSTEGDRSHDIDDYRQYSRAPGSNRGVVAAITRAQTNLSQASSGPTVSQLFFTINPAKDVDFDDDFDPRGTSKCSVPVAKDESSNQSQNALEDLFADVEFQASYPPISATASNSVLEQDYFHAFKANSNIPPPANSSMKAEFQAFPDTGLIDHGTSFGSFNPSFAAFDESPKSTTQGTILPSFEQLKLGSPSKTMDFFGSFNPFSTKDHGVEGNILAQQHRNPFLSTTTSSAFWDDPLITSLVDLSIGPKQDQIAPLSMNEIGAASRMVAGGYKHFEHGKAHEQQYNPREIRERSTEIKLMSNNNIRAPSTN